MPVSYDLIVIGAGPGGYPAALKAAALGKKVAVIERKELGGTCLNRGCIPTKTLLHTTGLYREVKQGKELGLDVETLQVDGRQLKARKEQVVEALRTGIAGQFKKSKIDLYQGTGTVMDAHLVLVEQTEDPKEVIQLEGQNILIATGSRPAVLPIAGTDLPGVVDSDKMLEQVDITYERLIIIGGGVIGMEFAQIYSDLGCKVTVLEAMDRILPNMDKEIAQNLKMISKKRGIEIHTGAFVKEIRESDQGVVCVYEEQGAKKEVTGDKVLIATGRKPNTEGLFTDEIAEKIGLSRGYIQVDKAYRTEIPSIYAIGDVIGGVQLAHAATAEGTCAVEHMLGIKEEFDMNVVPSCVYTDPEIAVVGMTADEAKAAGIKTKTGKYIMSVNGKSMLSDQERGFIKLVAEEESGKLLGAQLMCARATDMVGELELAISMGITAENLAAIIMPHPTFCEGIGEAAESIK